MRVADNASNELDTETNVLSGRFSTELAKSPEHASSRHYAPLPSELRCAEAALPELWRVFPDSKSRYGQAALLAAKLALDRRNLNVVMAMSVWLPSQIGVRDTLDGPVIGGRDRADFLAGLALKHLERVWEMSELARSERCVNLWLLERCGGVPLREIAARFQIAEAELVAEAFEALCGRGAEALMEPATLERRRKVQQQQQQQQQQANAERESTSKVEEAVAAVSEQMAEAAASGHAALHCEHVPSPRAAPIAAKVLRMQMAEAPEDGSGGTTRMVGKVIGDQAVEWVRASASPVGKLKSASLDGTRQGSHLATARCASAATYRVRVRAATGG